MKKRWTITVTGKVQGVWYRKNTQAIANNLQLCGSVKNKDDGSVFIDIEAHEEKFCEFINWCNHGSEKAIVNSLSIKQVPLIGYINFIIK